MTKRIQFSRNGGPEVLEFVDVEVGKPGSGEALVRNHAVGLNFLDVYMRTGAYPTAAFPAGLGMEGAGVVEAVGEGVTHVKAGDRVAYGNGPQGAYAELRVMPAANLVRLPRGVSFQEGAAMMLKGLTVQYLFRQTYRLQGNETILFHAAAGGVGLIACQWARALSVKLIGTVSSPEKAALAKAHGAWATIDYSKEDVAARVLELTKGAKCPVVYDGVGKSTWAASLDSVQARGLIVNFGSASGGVDGVNLGILASKGSLYVTRPTLATYATPGTALQSMSKELFAMVTSGKVKLSIDQTFALSDAAAAHAALESRKTTGSTILLP